MRFIIVLLIIAFWIYTIADCARTDASEMRNLPKTAWLLIIIIIGTIGSIAYWIAGRPRRTGLGRPPVRRILPPDDDPDFLRKI
jgi:Phospholipase_D-nuclease N-terminal